MAVDSGLSSTLGPPACEKDAKALQFIEEMTRNADSVQERVLTEILSRNSQTEYLRGFKLNGATDQDTFKSKLPVITYEDLQPEIQRIANGDRSAILSAHPISEFLTRFAYELYFVELQETKKENRNDIYSKYFDADVLNFLANRAAPGLQLVRGNSCQQLKKS